MAVFKTLKPKEKRYVFDFLGNRQDPSPAAAVFARFPLQDENFMPKIKGSVFEGIDLRKIGNRDETEMDKFIASFMEHFSSNMAKTDYAHFARECIAGFENFIFDGKEIKTVDEFLAINPQVMTLIAHDCWQYAQEREEFGMGE